MTATCIKTPGCYATDHDAGCPRAPSAGQSRAGWHRAETFLTCPQRGAYRYVLNLAPLRTSDPLAAGSLMHLGLMHHYLGMAGRPEARDPFEAMRTAPARIATAYPRIDPVLRAYRDHYRTEPFQVIDVEREFEIAVAGHPFTARIDLVVLQGGVVLFYDSKTSGAPAASAAREWEMSGQMIGQDVIGHAVVQATYGKPYGGLVINAIRVGAVPDFARHPITIAPSLREPWMRSIQYAAETTDRLRGIDPWRYPRNHGACMGRYGPCWATELCRRGRLALGEFVEEAP